MWLAEEKNPLIFPSIRTQIPMAKLLILHVYLLKAHILLGRIQKISPARGVLKTFDFFVINVFHREPYGPPREAIGPPGGPNASRGVSLPVFLLNSIATCDFPGGGGVPTHVPPLDPPMYYI